MVLSRGVLSTCFSARCRPTGITLYQADMMSILSFDQELVEHATTGYGTRERLPDGKEIKSKSFKRTACREAQRGMFLDELSYERQRTASV